MFLFTLLGGRGGGGNISPLEGTACTEDTACTEGSEARHPQHHKVQAVGNQSNDGLRSAKFHGDIFYLFLNREPTGNQ